MTPAEIVDAIAKIGGVGVLAGLGRWFVVRPLTQAEAREKAGLERERQKDALIDELRDELATWKAYVKDVNARRRERLRETDASVPPPSPRQRQDTLPNLIMGAQDEAREHARAERERRRLNPGDAPTTPLEGVRVVETYASGAAPTKPAPAAPGAPVPRIPRPPRLPR